MLGAIVSHVRGPEAFGLEAVADPSPAAWIGERLCPMFSGPTGLARVGEIIPAGYRRYARILHPAHHREEGMSPGPASPNGAATHSKRLRSSRTWRLGPMECVGQAPAPTRVNSIARCAVGSQFLYRGPVEAVTDLEFRTVGYPLVERRPGLRWRRQRVEPIVGRTFHSPSFWWPNDRAWFLSTEIDAGSTYVGGPKELIERVLADPDLEALPAGVDDPFDGVHPGMRMRHE